MCIRDRRAYRGPRVEAGELDSFPRYLVKHGSFNPGVAVGGEVMVTEIVGHDEYDIGTVLHFPCQR